MSKAKTPNRYDRLIESVFFDHYRKGMKEVSFLREELIQKAGQLKVELPKNVGDIIYAFRYRAALPLSIRELAPEGAEWLIRLVGSGKYVFSLSDAARIVPNSLLAETKIPDATPGVIKKYALGDEQALLAKLRYNRLIDIFTGITCYSLQNHLRTQVPDMGQVETDEVYVGLDKRGVHYIIPVQAKGGTDQLGIVQMEQDAALCRSKFPSLVCIPVAAQFIERDLIALFSFEISESGISMLHEKHYRLVDSEEVSDTDLQLYQKRPD